MNLENESTNKSIATKYTLEKTANAILFESGNVADSLEKIDQIINGDSIIFGKQDVFSLILDNFNVIFVGISLISTISTDCFNEVFLTE